MKELIFVLSDQCDHSKILVPDSGPAYGESMGWETVSLTAADWNSTCNWMIDLRLVERELAIVDQAIRKFPETTFLLRIVDPYWETCLEAINTRFIFRHVLSPNVGYVSGYQPEEASQLLEEACRPAGKFFVCPNPYEVKREVPIDETWMRRKAQIALAGAQNPALYPYRAFLQRKSWLDPFLWGKVKALPHPGYADIGDHSAHGIAGDSFIKWMSQFQFFYLCPGRCCLEFLKFRECAYAGCVPVGAAPRSMSEELSRLILPLDWIDYSRNRDHIFDLPREALRQRAEAYRRRFFQERNPHQLRRNLLEQISLWRK